MTVSFTSIITEEDYFEFFKFKSKMTKLSHIFTIFLLFLSAICIFNTVTTKDFSFLIQLALFGVLIAFLWIKESIITPKQFINRIKKHDKTLFDTPRKVTINDNSIEIETIINDERDPYYDCIYPYSIILAAYETDKGYYFFVSSTEVKFLMKRDLPKELIEDITNIIKTHCSNYRTIN